MLKVILTGLVGFAAGFGVATLVTKNKYEQIASEEIEAMRQYVKKKTGDEEFQSKKAQVEKHREDMKKFEEERINYATESGKEETTDIKRPYIIPEEEFVVDDEDFRKVSLEYYTESETLYEETELIPNIEEAVGLDCINLLHGISEDTIYVRNEEYGIDYEVIKIAGSGPER